LTQGKIRPGPTGILVGRVTGGRPFVPLTDFLEIRMKPLLAIVAASMFALTTTLAFAADPPKDSTKAAAAAKKPLEKPANVTAEAWAKMSDAEKQKAVDAASKDAAKPAKKEKKGGC
jgi:hypothetical protein